MCLSLLCCALGPGSCGLCCCKGKVKSSVTTRLLYFTFLFAVLVVTSIMLSPTVANGLQKAKILCTNESVNAPKYIPKISVHSLLKCNQFVGYLAAYRVCMAVAGFFLLLSIIMICVRSSKDPRAYIQNGFWLFKWLLVIGLVVAFFFIPDGSNMIFSNASKIIGMIGSILFIVLQIIFLVDFAHSWAENWIGRAEENENKWWYVLMLVFSIVFYVGSLVGIILLYVFFTELHSCSLNKFFISSTLIIGVVVSVIAILPWIQRVQPKSGLLQASIVTAYCTYITWSAVSTEPYGSYNGTIYNCQRQNSTLAVYGHGQSSSTAASAVGIAMLFLTVAYMCFNLSGHRQIRKLQGKKANGDEDDESLLGAERVYVTNDSGASDDDDDSESKWKMGQVDDEKEAVTYSYSFFHFMMMLAVLFFMMQLTNWADPGSANTEHFKSTWAATWVQMVSAWLCFGVYIWTLVAPLVLGTCRDFDYD